MIKRAYVEVLEKISERTRTGVSAATGGPSAPTADEVLRDAHDR